MQLGTHKFELRYNDQLIAPWPEGRQVYEDRSPINQSSKINCPVIFFQGNEDKVNKIFIYLYIGVYIYLFFRSLLLISHKECMTL